MACEFRHRVGVARCPAVEHCPLLFIIAELIPFLAMTGCQPRLAQTPAGTATTKTAPGTRLATTPSETYAAILDASFAHDRDRLRKFVFLPTDEERAQWVLNRIATAGFPPPGAKHLSPTVKMDGPVAVCKGINRMPDGSTEQSNPLFLVQRDGRWYFVIDFFEGSGLAEEETDIINEYIQGMRR